MKEGDNLLKTNTFGAVLENQEFTEEEKIVLLYFFTNIDKNIYAATDAMPNSLWALLEGGYSRSHLSMRMRFLNIFEEMQKDYDEGKLAREDLITVAEFSNQIKSGKGLNLSYFLGKAEQFMRKWAVQYGHDSLKDSDVVRFAIENVSQWSVSPIEEARLGAYQEKSTRYVEYSKESLITPSDLQEFEPEIRAWNDLLFTNYELSKPLVLEFIRKKIDRSTFKTEAAFDRTVSAKAFDIIRYFLPATALTSLGVVWPTREAERHISRLMSESSAELRAVGRALLEEGKKVSPGLLSHVLVNDYQISRLKTLPLVHKNILLVKPQASLGRSSDAAKIIFITPHIEAYIAASILFRHKDSINSYTDYLNICLNNKLIVEQTFKASFEKRGKFDAFPLDSEVGSILLEITVDYGAYRDLKRHRRNLFLRAPLTALDGFEYPEYVAEEPELAEIKMRVEVCAQKTAELHLRVKEKYPQLAGYIVMFANKQKMLWQMDPRQLVYVIELRTTPAGHYSYRTICQNIFKLIESHLPILSQYIRVDLSTGEEGRKKQEENTVDKLKVLGSNPHRIS